jgi:hypothetical protein
MLYESVEGPRLAGSAAGEQAEVLDADGAGVVGTLEESGEARGEVFGCQSK